MAAEFRIVVHGDHTQLRVQADPGTDPAKALRAAISALQAEQADLVRCPAHRAAGNAGVAVPRAPSTEGHDGVLCLIDRCQCERCVADRTGAAGVTVPAQPEPSRPDILERLTYHQLERDDLTLDECLSFLAKGWATVHGRTDRQMVMQILELLASAPAGVIGTSNDQPEEPR